MGNFSFVKISFGVAAALVTIINFVGDHIDACKECKREKERFHNAQKAHRIASSTKCFS